MIEVGLEEKRRRLRELRKLMEEYLVIPIFKDEDELRWSLEHGNIDFIANARFWRGAPRGMGFFPRLKVSRIKPWPPATVGYAIRALTIDEAVSLINGVIEEEREEFIYFRVMSPGIPPPRRSYVDEAMREFKFLEAELLRPDDYVRRDFHDL